MASGCGQSGDCCSAQSCGTGNCISINQLVICMKCKEHRAQALANQTEPLCPTCLLASVLSKFKTVLSGHAMVSASDKILLAFSGGPGSRVALEFLSQIQSEALSSRAFNAPAYHLAVAFIDEGLAFGLSSEERDAIAEKIRDVVLPFPLHILHLEDQQQHLSELLNSIKDLTSKEDLLEIMRMDLLDDLAKKSGFTKIILGSSVTRIASRVIAAAAKGQGFSLQSSVHYIDTRWHAAVVLPLRDCASKELALLCHFNNLHTVFVRNYHHHHQHHHHHHTINTLSSSFVTSLCTENSSRDHTIVKTVTKLTPFTFNKSPQPHDHHRRRTATNAQDHATVAARAFCTVCCAPLDVEEASDDVSTCPSCDWAEALDAGLLPYSIRRRKSELKSQIEDYLISS